MRNILRFVITAALALPPSLAAQTEAPEFTVESIWGTDTFSSDLVSVTWGRDPAFYTITDSGDDDVDDIYRVDARSGERTLVVDGSALVPPGADAPIEIEGYTFSEDERKVLILTNTVRVWRANTRGEYFVWDLDARRLVPVSTKPGYQMFAKFSPDARLVGFVREHNVFVTNLSTGDERQLTHDGSPDIINGTTDWVYEEELGLRDAFRFSPDGRYIAYWRLDQSAINPFYLIDELELYPELVPVRYPKAGTVNSSVRLGVVSVTGGDPQWIDLGNESDIYIAEMEFAGSPTEIWFTRLNRHQNRIDLLLADIRTGASRVIMTDRDEEWVDAEVPTWIDDGRRFLFPSDRDGYRQFFLHERSGRLVRKVTPGAWDVTDLDGVDERNGLVYFTGTGQGATQRHVYRVGLDGKGLTRLTPEPGWHSAEFNDDLSMWVHTYSTATTPPAQTLRDAEGKVVRRVAENAEFEEKVAALDLAAPEFMTIRVNGVDLHAWLIKPRAFDASRRYPLLLYVYGGPGAQTVTDSWGGQRYLWHQLMANEGYLVASVDNRGTGGRGAQFREQTYLRLGQLESDDQIGAARHFATLPYVDGNRIGIWGWSYGGYMTLMSLFRGEGVFKAGLSVAPVTDWRFYDTIYTERYMRTPQENQDGYDLGAPLSFVDRLRGNLLVVHGTGDDNVHFQNTTQLVHALEEAGKQFDMRMYPNKAHSISGRGTRVNLYGYFAKWIQENL